MVAGDAAQSLGLSLERIAIFYARGTHQRVLATLAIIRG